jgi:hypothetical protein
MRVGRGNGPGCWSTWRRRPDLRFVRPENRAVQIPDGQERERKGLLQGSRYVPISAKHKADRADLLRPLPVKAQEREDADLAGHAE